MNELCNRFFCYVLYIIEELNGSCLGRSVSITSGCGDARQVDESAHADISSAGGNVDCIYSGLVGSEKEVIQGNIECST